MDATQPTPLVLLRPAGSGDAELLTDLLAGLSPTSAFHRFLGGVGTPDAALVRSLLRVEPGRGALLALAGGPEGGRAVGHACWSVTNDGVTDIGVVVADAAQGRGVGTALFLMAAGTARDAGAHVVHLDVHPENRRLVAGLRRRFGGAALAWEHGLLGVDIPVDALSLRSGVATAA